MAGVFHFKQFSIDQTGCAMKVNTDGVLLSALVEADNPATILDIGTGTGVIALMLAQRFRDAAIEAVEIDEAAAKTATLNFNNSSFKNRLTVYSQSFTEFFKNHPRKKYDLIVSNPPFYINSLEASRKQMNLAKHADGDFFRSLILNISQHLTQVGQCWLILPLPTAGLVKALAAQHGLHLQKVVSIRSFTDSQPHREILVLSLSQTDISYQAFIIYADLKVYTEAYRKRLREYLTIF
jgi:tRNA1Val (adenine37-N6)-methyltransferase